MASAAAGGAADAGARGDAAGSNSGRSVRAREAPPAASGGNAGAVTSAPAAGAADVDEIMRDAEGQAPQRRRRAMTGGRTTRWCVSAQARAAGRRTARTAT